MSKIVQSRRWVIVAICCALAAALHFGLTEYATQITVTYCDGGTAKKGAQSQALLSGLGVISDTFCMSPAEPGHRPIAAFYSQTGLFPRNNIVPAVAVVAGAFLPFLLICLAGYLALDATHGRNRTAFAIGLFLTGLLLSVPLLIVSFLAASSLFRQGNIDGGNLWRDTQVIQMLFLFTILAASLFSASVWLWRTRSLKEPA